MESTLKVKVNKFTTLDSLPSGSAISLEGDSLYIISDNAPVYYKMGLATMKFSQFPISGYDGNEYVIAKKNKHDLESIVKGNFNGHEQLFVFGSGSSPRREMLLLIDPAHINPDKKIPLNRFYAALRKRHELSDEALNIEGAAMCNERLYLFLRKKNLVISLDWAEFCEYLIAPLENKIPKATEQYVQLPKHNGVSAGFSGAGEIMYEGKQAVLFCASLEHTSNAIDDGPVYGSYVGIMSCGTQGEMKIEGINLLKDNNGRILREKIESATVIKTGSNSYEILLISDNDDGFSKLFEATITIK